jgi:hypothetical protein
MGSNGTYKSHAIVVEVTKSYIRHIYNLRPLSGLLFGEHDDLPPHSLYTQASFAVGLLHTSGVPTSTRISQS